MIVSNMSGIHLLPLFKADLSYIRRIHQEAPNWEFGLIPGLEFTSTELGTPTVNLVNFDTAAEVAQTVNQTDLTYLGTAYKINTVAEAAAGYGNYYYKVNLAGKDYYSPIFSVRECTYNAQIHFSHSCNSVLTGTTAFVNKLFIADARIYADDEDAGTRNSRELSDGSVRVLNNHIRPVWKLEVLASHDLFERLRKLQHFSTVQVVAFGETYNVKPYSFRFEGAAVGNFDIECVGTFEVDAIDEVVDCACPAFIDEGGEGNGNGGASDVVHPNLDVTIDSSAFPTLDLVLSGTPLTPRTVALYKDGVYFSSAESVVVGPESAVYEWRVKVDGFHEQSALYTHVNECNLFEIDAFLTGATLNANYINIPVGATVSAVVLDDQDAEVATSLPFTPTTSGVYTIKATATKTGLTCIKTAALPINITDLNSCEHTATLTRVGDLFTVVAGNVTGSPVITYSAEATYEDGSAEEIATTETFTPFKTGMYVGKVTIGGCTVTSDPVLFVATQRVEIVSPVTVICDDRWRYQLFNEDRDNFSGSPTKTVTVNVGTLPAIVGATETDRIAYVNERVRVHLNQNLLSFRDATTFVSEYTYNPVTGDLSVHENFNQWSVLTVLFLQDLP